MGPGRRWDAIFGIWMEVRRQLDGGETWTEVRHNLNGCETLIWVAWMEFRHNLDGCEMIIYGPGWKWDGTWMGWFNIPLTLIKVGQKENADEMQILKPGWVWDSACIELRYDLDGSEMAPGWNWSTDLQRLMEDRWDLEGGETQVSAPWNWRVNLVTRMEVRWYMEGSDASILESGFRWVRTCMELKHILKPGWVWYGVCLNLRCNFADLDGGETYVFNPGWAWDGAWVELRCNLWTWMEVRCHQDGGEMEI